MKAVTLLGKIEFKGKVKKEDSISAVEVLDDFVILGADETNLVQTLKREGDHYKVTKDPIFLNRNVEEIDVEGIACEGRTVYVLGAHCSTRKSNKIDPDEPYETNLKLLRTVEPRPERDVIYRFHLDAQGKESAVESISLRKFLDDDTLLAPFTKIPSKENGIDLEGIAVRDGWLHVGFRGPVLRGNLTPVLKCRFSTSFGDAKLLFLDLGGRGFRDLTAVKDGFLILAGPVGDGPGSHQVYFWDGEDCLPGVRSSGKIGRRELIGEVPLVAQGNSGGLEGNPEGIALLKENGSAYEVMIVSDGVKDGDPTRCRVTRS